MREKTGSVMVQEVSEAPLLKEVSLIHTNQSKKECDQNRWQWMRHFFTEDTSPDIHPIIELQRRATWIGVALILQALNHTLHPGIGKPGSNVYGIQTHLA